MLRVPIRSRFGNGVLGFLGITYFVAAIVTLIYYVVTSWGAMGLTDYVLQLGLIVSAIGGLFFIAIAMQNRLTAAKSRSARGHQTAAAAGS
ncbi:MAG: hypothetical protein M3041_10850 [Acidobacteriota bacterium]|nr:hypothetical protein [Acidobacteriota bacterium]